MEDSVHDTPLSNSDGQIHTENVREKALSSPKSPITEICSEDSPRFITFSLPVSRTIQRVTGNF